MNVNEFLPMKERYFLAQGKRRMGLGLGWRNNVEFGHAKKFVKEVSFIRTITCL